MCLGQSDILGWGAEEQGGNDSRIRICRKRRDLSRDKIMPQRLRDVYRISEELATWMDLDVVQRVELAPKEVV